MRNPFGSIPVPKKGRTLFNESHSVSGTFPLSKVVPVFCTETIPGDSWRIKVFNLSRLETLIAPAMQQVDASLLWFKVPKRLVFNKFKNWYSGGVDGQDSSEKPHIHLYTVAGAILYMAKTLNHCTDDEIVELTGILFGPGSLWNYMGLPAPLIYDDQTGTWNVLSLDDFDVSPSNDTDFVDIMPFLAYHMIHDQYFMDQTLSTAAFEDSEEGKLVVNDDYNKTLKLSTGKRITWNSTTASNLANGGEVDAVDFVRLLLPFRRAWRKEYFTSALPSPQRGPQVTIGITDDAAPVTAGENGFSLHVADEQAGNLSTHADSNYYVATPGGDDYEQVIFDSVEGQDGKPGLVADLSGLSPITITAFRNLFKLQAFLEKNNVAGGRFIETILAHWAERVPDFTIQRAQHVRATSIPIQISEIAATANTAGVNSQLGDLGGIGRGQGNLGNVHIYTQEPCIVFGLYCVTIPPSYASQGISRMWQRITRFDEPWRDFQHIGEQAIKNSEIYFDYRDNQENGQDWGYQQRFSEFKYMPDRVVGDFQTSLAYWHMARMFDGLPELNADFVEQHIDERIFAVQNARPVTSSFYFDVVAKRKLSKFSTPKLT